MNRTQKWQKIAENRLAIMNDMEKQNAELEQQNRDMRAALQHLGSRPDGYCFCPREIPSGDHTGECREAQQALAKAGE